MLVGHQDGMFPSILPAIHDLNKVFIQRTISHTKGSPKRLA